MFESPIQVFSCEIGNVFKNIFYRTPPASAFVFFAEKQRNIQCYIDNFGL